MKEETYGDVQHRDNIIDELFIRRIIKYDFIDFFLGDYLGGGVSREVFISKQNPNHVIKIERGSQNANVLEWEAWWRVQYYKPLAKWFAPCLRLSHDGRILEMIKCKEPKEGFVYPKKVPIIFTDIQPRNWGMLKGKFVCFDYAFHLMMEKAMTTKMKKVKW